MAYQKILLALDLSEESSWLTQKVHSLFPETPCLLVHVLQPLPPVFGSEVLLEGVLVDEDAAIRARTHLQKLADQLPACCGIEVPWGDVRHEVHALAHQTGVDLIITGSHGRHGLALLLGSTADDLLHGAPCDVLALRLSTA